MCEQHAAGSNRAVTPTAASADGWQAEREAQHRAELDKLRREMEAHKLAITVREQLGVDAITKTFEAKLAHEHAERT